MLNALLNRKPQAYLIRLALKDPELMFSLYCVSALSLKQIADLLHCNIARVHKALKDHNITSRPQGRGKTQEAGRGLDLLDCVDSKAVSELPATYGECYDSPMPCPLVTCRYNTYLDIDPNSGAIIFNMTDGRGDPIPVEDVSIPNCALRVASREGIDPQYIRADGLLHHSYLALQFSTSRQGSEHILNEALAEALVRIEQWQ